MSMYLPEPANLSVLIDYRVDNGYIEKRRLFVLGAIEWNISLHKNVLTSRNYSAYAS